MATINLKSKTGRAKLAAQKEPYWERLSAGLHIGYRKTEGAGGSWTGRRTGTTTRYDYHAFGSDLTLDYDEACKAVLQWHEDRSAGILDLGETVADVCRAYVESLKSGRREKAASDAQRRFERYVYPETVGLNPGDRLPSGRVKRGHTRAGRKGTGGAFIYDNPIGSIEFAKLVPDDVTRWLYAQIDHADPEDPEAELRAQDSANRNMKSLKAAFGYGKDQKHLVASDKGWKGAKMFKHKSGKLVGASRDGYLNPERRTALLAALQPDLRQLATAMLLIGARPGELANAKVKDFDKTAGTLILDGKTGERTVNLSTKAFEFFRGQAKDRIGKAHLFCREDGKPWTAPAWGKSFRESRDIAGMPETVLYCMRHTYISEAIKQGLNIYTVAEQTGTSIEIIESNYFQEPDGIRERLDKVSIL